MKGWPLATYVERCPLRSTAADHFYDDGHCRCWRTCDRCHRRVRWAPSSEGWVTVLDGTAECDRRGGHRVNTRRREVTP